MGERVLVDTTVWVEVLRDRGSPCAPALRNLARACTTGVVLQEVLQGLSRPREIARVSSLLLGLPAFPAGRDVHLRAAALYRRLRSRGVTAGTIDVLLAQLAIDHDAALWSLDRGFEPIASTSRLRLFRRPAD